MTAAHFRCSTVSNGESDTRALGQRIATRCRGGEVLLLIGDLGAGKTVFVQGLAEGLGATGITSPTFTLLHIHRDGRLPLVHADLYRLSGPAEVADLGIEDVAVGAAVLAVEWPDRLGALAADGRLEVRLMVASCDRREIRLCATDERHAALLAGEPAAGGAEERPAS
ncbi:MAG TPA: tRNA (adenosine(37)-N6)-threonylcarbamoyltransferase complex ATPase subunit type 1 TsaE [Chthonomonadales bacterium]|nr:tRNA (adenosine(37)-N6)-threonylcarbamoyltransferase complex ATPase subunit type 1 TsaE [Chthonomonadales bacterium]